MPRIVPGLAEVASLARPDQQKVVSAVQAWQEVGGLVGRVLLAFLALRIVGRQRNMLVRPDGVRHWPSFPSEAWREIAPVMQIQLVQDAADHVIARIVAPREISVEEQTRFIAALQGCLGWPFRITLTRVAAIARGAGGKYEDFVSLL